MRRPEVQMINREKILRNDWVFFVLLLALTCAVYWPALNDTVIFDDAQLLRNGNLRVDLLATVPRIVTNATYALVDRVCNANIIAQKLFNVAIHGFVVVLLYFATFKILSLTTKSEVAGCEAKTIANKASLKIGVAVFALNPSAVYAVAYLMQRSVLLATMFVLLMISTFISGLVRRNITWYGVSGLCFVLAILSKELAVMSIFIPALLYVYARRPRVKHVLAILLVMATIALVVAWMFLTHYGISLMTPYEPAAAEYVSRLNLLDPDNSKHIFALHVLNQLNLFFIYGALWFLPNPNWMAIDLQPVFPTLGNIWNYVPLALMHLLMAAIAIRALFGNSPKHRLIGLFVIIPMVLFQTEFLMIRIQEPFSIYRSYLWAISIPGLVAIALGNINGTRVLTTGAAVVVLLGALSHDRTRSFASDFSIWTDAIDKANKNPILRGFGIWRASINRGAVYLRKADIRRALEDFHRADSLGALNGVAQFNIGMVFQMNDQHKDAIDAFKKAEPKNPLDPILKYRLGESYYALQMYQAALGYYEAAASLVRDPEGRLLPDLRRGETLVALKRFPEARLAFDGLLKTNPESIRAKVGSGMANLGDGNIARAQELFNEVLAGAQDANAYYGLALASESLSHHEQAKAFVERSIALEPGNTTYLEYKSHLHSDERTPKKTGDADSLLNRVQ